MREILFRGKRIDNGQWVEGFYYQAKLCRSDKELRHYITIPHPESDGQPSDHIMVHPETVGQFTGLTDKNGRKIFEGDICRTMVCDMTVEKDCGIVCYDSMGMLSLKRVDDVYSDFFFHINIGCVDAYSIEVIGNIHDNPELLDQ